MINNFAGTDVASASISISEVFMALVTGNILDEPYEPSRIGKISRLTTTQRDLYLDNMLHPDNTVFSLGLSIKLPQNLDTYTWEQAIRIVCQEDDTIKTKFIFYQGEAFQFVDNNADIHFEFIEIGTKNADFNSLEQVVRQKIKVKLELDKNYLFKNILVKDEQGSYTAILGAPHILFDGYSGKVFFERVAKIYLDLKAGNITRKFKYSSFYDSIQEHLLEFDTQEIQQYWQESLSKVIPVTSYIKSKEENKAQSRKVQITGNELEEIRKYCQLNKCNIPAFFRAVYGIYLSKYLQAPGDFVFYDIIGKRNKQTLNVLGCLYQVVPIIIPQDSLEKNNNIGNYLSYISDYRKNLNHYQNISVFLQKKSIKDEQLKFFYNFYNFSVLNVPVAEENTRLTVYNSFADNEVHLLINEFKDSLEIEFFYNEAYFVYIKTLERLLFIANQIIQGCEYFEQLNILPENEHQELLENWNDTSTNYALDKCIHQLFEVQVERSPHTLALIFKEAENNREQSSLTYQQLNQRANQLAHYLHSLGVKPDMPVGICVERSLEMAIAVLAVLKAGGAYVPLDPAYPKERLAFTLEDTQISVLLTQHQLLPELPKHQAQVICLDTDWDKIGQYSQENFSTEVTAENLAYIIYTSGSTGRPKGICLGHRPLVNLLEWHLNSLLTGVRTLQFASLSFDASFHEMFAAWCSGGTLFLISESLRRDSTALAHFIHNQEIEKAILPVVILQQMAEVAASGLKLFTSLKEVTTTGEQLQITPAIVKLFKSLPHCSFHNHYGPSETHVVTALAFNQNPDTWSTYPSIGRPITNTQIYVLDAELKPVPIGVPGELYIGGVSLARGYLNRLDLTKERFIPNPFQRGRGAEDQGSRGGGESCDRLYKTGDLACYLPDGNIEYFGRIDQQVKIRGFRIELGEIETILLQHPDVREAAVIAREDVPGEKRLVAYIVSNLIPERVPYQSLCRVETDDNRIIEVQTEDISNGGVCLVEIPFSWAKGKRVRLCLRLPVISEELWIDGCVAWSQGKRAGVELTLTPSEKILFNQSMEHILEAQHLWKTLQRTISGNLRRFLQQKLPDYMLPSSFVMLNALPLTANGKVDRRSLPVPDRNRWNQEQFVSPRTAVEEVLTKIWLKVLKLQQISVHDNFFEIGGHSLLATQVISRIRDTYQLDIPLRRLFDAPTVASLAESIEVQLKQNQEWHTWAIAPVTRNQNLPLSFAQQRLWFLEQLLPDSPFYNLPQSFHLFGQVNVKALEQSINEIVRRHEVLRTAFASLDGQPVQIIIPALSILIHLVDLRSLSESEKDTEIQRLRIEEFQQPFNINRGPLLRAALIQIDAEESLLLLSIHHIVFDGWSVSVLFQELTLLYQAFANGLPSPLAELPIQYADFAVWQRQWLQGKVISEQLSYWKQQLADLPILQLPSDRPRPAIQTYRGARQPLALSKSLSEAVTRFSQHEGCTLFMTLLAAFQTLLYRYTSSEDIVVGSLIANRHHQEIESLIGFFVNTLVLRSDFSNSPTFRQLLKQVREVTLEAYAHQDVPFEKLVEELEPERDLRRHPLFQICFALQNVPIQALKLSGLTINHRLEHNGTAKFDLFLELFETPDGISGWFEYSTDLFDAATISRLGENFQTLLAGIVANPDQKVADLPLLTSGERQQLLVEWNQTQVDYPQQTCIHQLFEAQVKRVPDSVAAIFADQQITYRQLNARANQLARHLQALGVGPDVLVGICLERSLDAIVALLGILKAGGAYIPLDPAYPQQRLSLMVSDSQLSVLLTQQHLLAQLPQHQAHIVCLDKDWQDIATQSQDNLDTNVNPDNLAYVIYTSGSTGKPKGVQIIHGSVVNFLHFMGQHLELTEQDTLLSVTTLSFDIAVLEIFLPITLGARVVTVSREEAMDGIALIAKLSNGVTVMQATPATWQLLLEASWQGSKDLKILCGGEALPRKLAKQLQQRCATLWNVYGPTETTIWSATYKVASKDGQVLIGRPIANTQFYILDSQLQPVPVGVPGELYIGGAGLARGYLHRPDLTEARFIPNPFGRGRGAEGLASRGDGENCDRLYKTGDLVRYLPDGNVEYLSRIDHQVKIRGFRIELGEIEAVLTQHPSVQKGVVIDREDIPGQKRLVAYVVQNQQDENAPLLANWQTEHLSQWQTIYDQTYKQTTEEQNRVFNTIGWNSSYTGMPIPAEEMREWVDCTVERILSFQPSQVLEIGCGTGLLLCKIISHCSKYWGTDFAPEALRQIQQLQMSGQSWPQLTLLQRPADNFEGIEADAFNTVIINSVVQYFPSIDYLLQVLTGAVNAVQPGGFIFIGDVRSLPLLEAYHTSVVLYQASSTLSTVQLQERIRQRLNQEEELVIDPDFFRALGQHFPKIGRVQIQVKRGQHHNELTKFRYDAILQIGTDTDSTVGITWLDWQQQQLTLSSVRHLLLATQPEILGIKNVPNARVIKEIKTIELLNSPEGPKTVGEVLSHLEQLPQIGIDPEELWNLSEDLPYFLDITWSESSVVDCYDVVFRHKEREGVTKAIANRDTVALKPWNDYANQPLQGKFTRKLAVELRRFLEQNLPEYMIPTAFVSLEKLPLTPNGKLDRRSLPAPDQSRSSLEAALVTPRTPTESKMVAIWAKVLGSDRVGIQDNFFELGGNSLLATQLMMYLRETFQVELPVRYIFEQQTIEGLSQIIDKLHQKGTAVLDTVVNLKAEAVLDPNIYPQGILDRDITQPNHIFLTGATGFLGAFLIHELLQQTQAKIYCLVRAKNETEGFKRLQKTLEKYLIWDAKQSSRIIPIPGDLALPRFGVSVGQFEKLAQQIDVIYHSGAQVNFAKPYSVIKAANVLGTQEVLRLACQHQLKPVHYISTMAVFGAMASINELNVLYEDDDIDNSEPYLSQEIGYTQSKWVAEKLVWIAKSRGIPVTVIRSGFLMGHPQTGVTNTDDFISRLIVGCIQVGSFPELINQKQDLITVDYASKAIIQISQKKESLGKAFHIVPLASENIDLIKLFELISACGYQLQKVPYSQWTDNLINQAQYSQSNPLFALLPMFTEKVNQEQAAWELYQNTADLDCCNTLNAIANTSIKCPSMDAELISKYLDYFQRSGFLSM
ncbi:non-ribosomal peptide synthetase [Nostoc sp. ChiQUE01b]|uniref:non-ribosomal peptide synthetase n=1 Tax=Nostoc sp. ChiQUE01b TaxID=3075376 RepID=UPI002AD1E08D|nr:non-ribosomal peptide synthetase [Nostoc sp. ChiQUE01b]MDZ8263386.1 amino acid adenylation domain-containing protein [Nostoc sp. ChiQUE01b]